MKVYVFGNEYIAEDKRPIEVARELEGAVEGISFVFVSPNEDVPFVNERHVVILDTVQGIQDVALVEGDGLDELSLSPRSSADHRQAAETTRRKIAPAAPACAWITTRYARGAGHS